MRYALIKNNKVENIIIADYASAHEIKSALGMDDAINVDDYPIDIGDLYENGYFMTKEDVYAEDGTTILIPKGTVIERDLTKEEKFKLMEAENEELKAIINELVFEIIPSLQGGI